ncbi:MAG: hypothetical protein ALECFALPRED_010544 [Alectoria fallacina]|uniref:Uncharacterized protein n=1 Tax=Alectoria fallacina TaxID=1903189 RepID=A0A8H3J9W6_9LECA|nr:MAG: hypothetical protein ALECFALPRED_010544 [Alectoria fallacina]
MGPLNIRHLKTAYGEYIDLEKRVVGDLFDDRGVDGSIRNSILEVHRYPPEPDEQISQRFSSLAPNSSARPRKRPLELPPHSYPSRNSRNLHREIPSIEESDVETDRPFGTAPKRQCTDGSRLNRTFHTHQSMGMRKDPGGGSYHSSQTSGTQESVHQVLDSQKSPGKKHANPYGTPTSLPFTGLQESIPVNQIDLSAIPDSPLGREATSASGASRGAMHLDRQSTKSESPELRISVHKAPPANPIDASGEQPTSSANSPEPSTTPFIFNSALQPVSTLRSDEDAKDHGSGVGQKGRNPVDIHRTTERRTSTVDSALPQAVRSSSKTSRKSDPIFDPIESDTESFHEKQQMQSAKRLRSSRTPTTSFTSLRAFNKAGTDSRSGQFLVPSVPKSRTIGARVSLGEATSPGPREKNEEPKRDLQDANVSVQKDLELLRKHDAESPEHAQSEPCHNGQTKISCETPKKDTGHDEVMSADKTSSQATTLFSQESNVSADGTEESVVQQIDNLVSSRDQGLDKITPLIRDVNGLIHNPDEDCVTQEARRLAEEAEEQQEKKRIREKKTEEKRLAKEALEKENAAKNEEAAERKANEERLADEKRAREEARAERSAQAKKAKAKEEELAEAKRLEETRRNAVRLAEEKKTSERLAHERQTREMALAEEANKVILAAEGAKQIDAEKKEKEKARHKEMAAKNQADKAKVVEQTKGAQKMDREKKAREEQLAREKAQQLADNECKDAKHRTRQAGTATAMRKHGHKILADQDVQKLRDSTEVRSRASTTASASSNIAGPKRSMTPVVPGSSINKSSPNQRSLGSSPLSSRCSGNMDAPLRSALRQTPSALRRSVSSVSFDVPPRSKLNEYIPSTPKPKSLQEINNELAPERSSATNVPKKSSRTVPNAPSETPMQIPMPKNAPDSRITKTPAKNGKVQTKLQVQVIREVKKLKGRAVDPPVTSMQAPKKEIVLSSGEDSSTSEEPVWQTGNAKAGPSSRKPTFPVTTSQDKTAEMKPPVAPIDPNIRNIKVENGWTAAPATLPHSTCKLDTTPLQKSTSRSPALALSETFSLSSGSASNSAPDSDSELESDYEELQAPSSKTPTAAKNGMAPITVKGFSKAVNVGVKQPKSHLQGKASSQSSQASSSRSRSIVSMHGDGKHVDQAAEKQLQLESQQTVTISRVKQASSTSKSGADDKVINQGLDHAGRLPNGIRPAYYKYPALSELKKLPRAITPVVKPKLENSSSQPLLPVGKSCSDSSSSSSDDSSSESDEDEDVNGVSSQASSKKNSRRYRGLRGVIKLANTIRSKLGPTQQ